MSMTTSTVLVGKLSLREREGFLGHPEKLPTTRTRCVND